MNYFIVSKKQNSNLWLQKLMYFAYKEALLNHNTLLFKEEFEAWKYGPVLTECYFIFKEYLHDGDYDDSFQDLKNFFQKKLTEKKLSPLHDSKIISILDKTFLKNSKFNTGKIVEESHDKFWFKAQNSRNLVINTNIGWK